MTKSDLIAQMAHKLDVPSREASAIVSILLNKMIETLAEGRSIVSFIKIYFRYNHWGFSCSEKG